MAMKLAFGLVIRKHRHALGLNQEELAYRAKLHRTFISLIERGQRTVSIETVVKLAKALDTTASALLGEMERQLDEHMSDEE